MQNALQRLAKPRGIRPIIGNAIMRALIFQGPFAGDDGAHDLNIFARPHNWAAIGLAMPTFHHLRPGRPNPTQKAIPGKGLQGQRR